MVLYLLLTGVNVWRSQDELEDFLANKLGPAARFAEVHHQVNPR